MFLTAGSRKASRVSRPEAGHFAAAKVEAGDLITEFRVDAGEQPEDGEFQPGQEIKVDLFEAGQGFFSFAGFRPDQDSPEV